MHRNSLIIALEHFTIQGQLVFPTNSNFNRDVQQGKGFFSQCWNCQLFIKFLMLHKKDKTLNKSDFKRVLNCEIFITIVNAIINQVLIKIPTDVADKKNKTENSSQLI